MAPQDGSGEAYELMGRVKGMLSRWSGEVEFVSSMSTSEQSQPSEPSEATLVEAAPSMAPGDCVSPEGCEIVWE